MLLFCKTNSKYSHPKKIAVTGTTPIYLKQ